MVYVVIRKTQKIHKNESVARDLTLYKRLIYLNFSIKDYMKVILIIYKHYVQINEWRWVTNLNAFI